MVFKDLCPEVRDLQKKIKYFPLAKDSWAWNRKLFAEDNKANLRDLIAVTGLVILLKLDSNSRFFALVTLKFDG